MKNTSRATHGNRQLALASAINCTCALGLQAVIPEPTRTALINHARYVYELPAGIRIEISVYVLTVYASLNRRDSVS